MNTIQITGAPAIHTPRLDEELRAGLGAVYVGVSTGGGGVRVHLTGDAGDDDETQARNIIMAHDHTQPASAEIAKAERDTSAGEVNQADLSAMLASLTIADTVPELREQMMALTRIVGHLAVAQGFTPTVEDTGG